MGHPQLFFIPEWNSEPRHSTKRWLNGAPSVLWSVTPLNQKKVEWGTRSCFSFPEWNSELPHSTKRRLNGAPANRLKVR